jgi:hypothetical protein
MREPISHIDQPTAPQPDRVGFEDKFIAFVDILGFSEMVRAAEANGDDLSPLLDLTRLLTAPSQAKHIASGRASVCPHWRRTSPDLSFKVTQISDCVVFSSEVSPAGIINLMSCCFEIALSFLQKGFLCRGCLTRGNIYHTDNQFIGSGYMEAYSGETKVSIFKLDDQERGTPFIQLEIAFSITLGTQATTA